jgi:Transglutaminase-like superfamily
MVNKQFTRYIYLLTQLVVFDLELTIKGFTKTFRRYSKTYKNTKLVHLDESNHKEIFKDIEQLFSTLDVVCTWYPKKADCIHKTFLGYKIIRKRYSIPVEMVVGVRKFPFEAHAWLQCYGKNFFNDSQETDKYKVILQSNNFIEGDSH